MKKKIAALLTAALVMTMSTATVFAAESSSWKPAGTVDSVTVTDGVTVTVDSDKTLTVEQEQNADAKFNEAVSSELADGEKVAGYTVQAIVELTPTGTIPSGGVTVTVKVSGINAGDNVIVLHQLSNGTWQKEKAHVDANGNVVIEGLTSFSPFVFITYTVQQTAQQPEGIPAWWYLLQERQAEAEAEELQTSPKTGVVIPVAAMTAGICLAGAAVCGKKVKFN